MEKIVERRIVYLKEPIPDPNGNPGKAGRPYVVIRLDPPPNEEQPEGSIVVVCITSTIPQKMPEEYVPLKHGYQSRSKLRERSAAVCNWLARTIVSNIDSTGGLIDPLELVTILTKVQSYQKPDESETTPSN